MNPLITDAPSQSCVCQWVERPEADVTSWTGLRCIGWTASSAWGSAKGQQNLLWGAPSQDFSLHCNKSFQKTHLLWDLADVASARYSHALNSLRASFCVLCFRKTRKGQEDKTCFTLRGRLCLLGVPSLPPQECKRAESDTQWNIDQQPGNRSQ